jgi:hypothetical protein
MKAVKLQAEIGFIVHEKFPWHWSRRTPDPTPRRLLASGAEGGASSSAST